MAILTPEKSLQNKPYALISACLLGCNTRYAGDGKMLECAEYLKNKYNLIPVCPEQLGGLATPREPAEQRVVNGAVHVINKAGVDVTEQFKKGASETLRLAKLFGCELAILKERSPSCGYGMIYDGTFTGTLTEGNGLTAGLLSSNGIRVIGETSDELR